MASSLKALRKPTVGAWLANLLTRQRTKDIDRLIALGAELRDGRRGLDGDRIRRVSKERADTVSRLVRDASSLAARQGQAVSGAALAEVEATLDAAFADAASADALRAGRLTSALQYSGLGLVPDATSVRPAGGTPRSGASVREAERTLERGTATPPEPTPTSKARGWPWKPPRRISPVGRQRWRTPSSGRRRHTGTSPPRRRH